MLKSNQIKSIKSSSFWTFLRSEKILKIKFKRIKYIGIEMKKKHVHCKLFETN